MKEIGGYFEIEHSNISTGNIHKSALKLNSGRNCLAYILQSKNYKKIYLPYYLCNAVLEPVIKNNIAISYYSINWNLEPVSIPQLKEDEAFLYINYYGLKGDFVRALAARGGNVIIDNSQALFEQPVNGQDTFYSLRKFAGAADGAFLYFNSTSNIELKHNDTYPGAGHMYQRKNYGAGAGYSEFQQNEHMFTYLPVGRMSPATEHFLDSYDFEKNKTIRERNFLYLHRELVSQNKLGDFEGWSINGPLCYPFYSENDGLRAQLIQNKVFVPTYWPDLNIEKGSFEDNLVKYLHPLPIDQRYSLEDMEQIIKLIKH